MFTPSLPSQQTSSTLDLAATLSGHEECCVAVSLCVQQIANNEQSNTEGHRIGSKAQKTLSTHSHNTRHKYQESDTIRSSILGLTAEPLDPNIPHPLETPPLDPTSPVCLASERKVPVGKRQTPAGAQRTVRRTGRPPRRIRTLSARIRAPEAPSSLMRGLLRVFRTINSDTALLSVRFRLWAYWAAISAASSSSSSRESVVLIQKMYHYGIKMPVTTLRIICTL